MDGSLQAYQDTVLSKQRGCYKRHGKCGISWRYKVESRRHREADSSYKSLLMIFYFPRRDTRFICMKGDPGMDWDESLS